MKSFFNLLFLITTFVFTSSAQKVDIDNFRIYISNAKFPLNYIPAEQRTFHVAVLGDWDNAGIAKSIFIPGWQVSEEKPTLDIKVNINRMVQGGATTKSRVQEQKDKNGKVTSSTTYYQVTSTNQGSGAFKVLGLRNEMPKVLSKKEQEKLAKKEKEKKEKEESNPFLKNVDAPSKDADVDLNTNKPLAYHISLDQTFTYTTGESTSASAASREWSTNSNSQYENHKNKFVEHVIGRTNASLAEMYAYIPVRHWVKFKELDSEKHPEYTMYSNATTALKTIFGKMRYNKPVSEIENDLNPIIKYFEGIVDKYSKDEKHEKRLRAATLYNLVVINQYLDHHDKAIELANQMITLDLEKDDAEECIEESNKIKKELEFHKMTSRHITPLTDAEKEDKLGEGDGTEEKP